MLTPASDDCPPEPEERSLSEDSSTACNTLTQLDNVEEEMKLLINKKVLKIQPMLVGSTCTAVVKCCIKVMITPKLLNSICLSSAEKSKSGSSASALNTKYPLVYIIIKEAAIKKSADSGLPVPANWDVLIRKCVISIIEAQNSESSQSSFDDNDDDDDDDDDDIKPAAVETSVEPLPEHMQLNTGLDLPHQQQITTTPEGGSSICVPLEQFGNASGGQDEVVGHPPAMQIGIIPPALSNIGSLAGQDHLVGDLTGVDLSQGDVVVAYVPQQQQNVNERGDAPEGSFEQAQRIRARRNANQDHCGVS